MVIIIVLTGSIHRGPRLTDMTNRQEHTDVNSAKMTDFWGGSQFLKHVIPPIVMLMNFFFRLKEANSG